MFLASGTGDPLIDWLSQAGATAILAFVVISFFKGWIVRGVEVEKIRAERDKALELVYKQAEITQRALEAGEKV